MQSHGQVLAKSYSNKLTENKNPVTHDTAVMNTEVRSE